MSNLTTVDFHGAQMIALLGDTPETTMVAMKPVVEGMGLDWDGQRLKLLRHPVLKVCAFVTKVQVSGDDQVREHTFLPLNRLNFWLATIHPDRIKDAATRQRVIEYQTECADALFSHFFGKTSAAQATYHPVEAMAVCNQFLAFTMAALPNLGERSRQALIASTTEYVVGRALIPPPVVDEAFYTTGEIAAEAGVSPQLAGRRANAAGLKTPEYGEVRLSKASHSDKQVEQFYWNEHGRASLLSILRGLQ